jgi:hypothetical protein
MRTQGVALRLRRWDRRSNRKEVHPMHGIPDTSDPVSAEEPLSGEAEPAKCCGCLLCGQQAAHHRDVDGVAYFECAHCDFIFADPVLIAAMDAGNAPRYYDEDYWKAELASARERAYGPSLARVAEALLYCRVPVERFVDIGTGPGYLLDSLAVHLPSHRDRFYGVELFPPDPQFRSNSPNYRVAPLASLGMRFECGVCVEVLEHLTPTMAKGLAASMWETSVEGSLYVFNTGLTSYVRSEDPGYLDPFRRGHVTCWSVTAARRIFGALGFTVHEIPGKTWAFVVERPLEGESPEGTVVDRIWHPVADNRKLLSDPQTGDVMYLLGRESARAYC